MSLVVTIEYEPDGSPSLRDRRLEIKVYYVATYCSTKITNLYYWRGCFAVASAFCITIMMRDPVLSTIQ